MDAQGRLDAAREALHAGKHADALEGLAWFYDHAVAEDPAMVGVRLTYALSPWAQLAQIYPPAREALQSVRARAAAAVLDGTGGLNAFRDVEAIDRYNDQRGETYQLFVDMEQRDATLPPAFGRIALNAIVAAGDFARAARIAPVPEEALRNAAAELHHDLVRTKLRKYTRAPTRWAFIRIYTDKVRQVLAIVRGLGEAERAASLARMAIAQLASSSVRREAAAGIAGRTMPRTPDLKRHRLREKRARQRETAARRHARTLTKSP